VQQYQRYLEIAVKVVSLSGAFQIRPEAGSAAAIYVLLEGLPATCIVSTKKVGT
jgi:hypothetical protein